MTANWIRCRFAWYPVRVYENAPDGGLRFKRWAWWEHLTYVRNLNHGLLHFEITAWKPAP